MLHEITLGDKTMVAVGLLYGNIDEVRILELDKPTLLMLCNEVPFGDVPLSHAQYKLIGIYPDMIDEQCKEIFGMDSWGDVTINLLALGGLFQREKLYRVNPYGGDFYFDNLAYGGDTHTPSFKDWQEAQARTFAKWALLLKID